MLAICSGYSCILSACVLWLANNRKYLIAVFHIIVTLKSIQDSDSTIGFGGFMIQGRTMADNSPVGTWLVEGSVAQTICNGEVS